MYINQIKSKKTILLLLICIFFVTAFYPVWEDLIKKWSTSDQYSHGFLILPICLYIILGKRQVLLRTPITPYRFGLVMIIVSIVLYIFSIFAEINTLASISMVFTIICIILYIFGTAYLRTISFPIMIMFLMIPIPSQIFATATIPLQLFVSKMSHSILVIFGMPIFREGNVIVTSQVALEVVQACSGLRSMTSLFTLSLIIGYFTLSSKFLITVLSLVAIPIAVIVNIFRVMVTVIALHFFNFDLTKGSAHTIYGLFAFLFSLMIIVLISKVFSTWNLSKQEG